MPEQEGFVLVCDKSMFCSTVAPELSARMHIKNKSPKTVCSYNVQQHASAVDNERLQKQENLSFLANRDGVHHLLRNISREHRADILHYIFNSLPQLLIQPPPSITKSKRVHEKRVIITPTMWRSYTTHAAA